MPRPRRPRSLPTASGPASSTWRPSKLIPAPDCGMKYLPRALAFAKLKALSDGAALVRKEL